MSIQPNSSARSRILLVGTLLVVLLLTACGASPSQPTSFKVGLINGGSNFNAIVDGFKAGMTDLGYVEGKNLTYVYDGPAASGDKLDSLAQNLLAAKVDLVVSFGTPASQTMQKATAGTNLPVVFVPVSDPVQSGIVQSLQNPGGNITGIATGTQVHAQRLEWLLKVAPNIKQLYVPYDATDPAGAIALKVIQAAAPKLGVELVTKKIQTNDDMTAAMANIPDGVDAIFTVPGTIVGSRMDDLVKVSLAHKLPLSSSLTAQVPQGPQISFGFTNTDAGKQAAQMADKILKGAKPADLPVETSEFYLAINLKTAQAINLNIPDDVLQQARIIVR